MQIIIFLLFTLFSSTTTTSIHHQHHNRRRLLHQPLFPLVPTTPPPLQSQSPSPSPFPQPHHQQIPKYPFSTTPPNNLQKPFFQSDPPPPPPPPPSPPIPSTFPANISSLIFPHSRSKSAHLHVIILAISLSFLSAAILAALAAVFIYFRGKHRSNPDKTSASDGQRLVPPNFPPSDGSHETTDARRNVSSSSNQLSKSSEFLYLGTLVNPRSGEMPVDTRNFAVKIGVSKPPSGYRKLGSPELKPLPPLPRYNSCYPSGEMCFSKEEVKKETTEEEDDEEDEFFSPRGSSGRKETREISTPARIGSSSTRENFGSPSLNSRTASYPCLNSCSPTNSIPSKVSVSSSSSWRSDSSGTHNSPDRVVQTKQPPPPPPPPPPRYWEVSTVSRKSSGLPVLVAPLSSRPVVVKSLGPRLAKEELMKYDNVGKNEETPRPKLKPLHWDKVRASSDRAMVWDQLKSSSFQLNEEMIETLFMVNNSNSNPNSKDIGRKLVHPISNQENQVLDPKKSQNIAILLRALNVTVDEVCEVLLEGNSDSLGTELLESLLKMAPTKEEERKIKEFKDESPFKLGPAEKFLKAVLDIPFAFKRVDAMLYIANFDSEVEYLKSSFGTLQAACEELRKSRMFLKLLEAVLKTGNRMNVGTNRGDAHAFKLDTLLKLVDVKGTDGKTTLLHFVVQEIIRAEGSLLSGANPDGKTEKTQESSFQDDVEFRKLGLQVVSNLSGELTNVKKAAAMDSDVLSSDVAKLAAGSTKIMEVVKLNEDIAMNESSQKFSNSMNEFLKKAEQEIISLQAQESVALSMVKEITEYFHGNSVKEEAHPFRIFLVVKDFLSTLDQVCKEVGRINERTIYSSVRPVPTNPNLPSAFPGFNVRQHCSSSDDESSSKS